MNKLSFFIHDFMSACGLDRERIDACAFMAATRDGPVSMCLHNAKRDSFILQPVKLRTAAGEQVWDPVTGDGPRRAGRSPRAIAVSSARSIATHAWSRLWP